MNATPDLKPRSNGTPPEVPVDALPQPAHLSEIQVLRLQAAHADVQRVKAELKVAELHLQHLMQQCVVALGLPVGDGRQYVVDLEHRLIGPVMPPAEP